MINLELENVWVNFNISSNEGRKNTYLSRYFLTNKTVDIVALRNINISLNEDDRVGLIGNNGAGKSTLLRVMSGILPPTEGRFSSNGEQLSLIRGSLSLVQQASVLQNIKLEGLRLGLRSTDLKSYMSEVEELVDMDDFIYSPIAALSEGMKNRVRLTLSSMRPENPDILIMDEWIGVMDKHMLTKDSSLSKLIDNSKIFIFASHNKHLLRSLCNKGIYIENGEIKDVLDINKAVEQFM